MTEHQARDLKTGKIYAVRHRNFDKSVSRRTRRAFIGMESRFGGIPCAVFTSRLPKKGHVELSGDKIIFDGCCPLSEISVPVYDLLEAREVA